MSTNLYQRLRAILPSSPTQIAEVVSINADGTSTLRLPTGLGQQVYASGVSVGSIFTARGTSVAIGEYAYVRDGVVQARAPTASPSDVVVGTVVALPFGPARLAVADPLPVLAAGKVGVAYTGTVAGVFSGGYPAFSYSVISGALPAGLVLNATTGALTGTPTAAGSYSIGFRCADSTRRAITAASLALTVAP